MIFPNRIRKGKLIGTTAVSMSCVDERDCLRLENAYKTFDKFGFGAIETANVRSKEIIVSSSGEERAKQFLSLWQNKDVDWIIATSGGEILMEMLPYLQIDEANAKWIQGYSDVSLLLYYITTKWQIATINGANVKSFGMEPLHESLVKNFEVLQNASTFKQKSFELFEGTRSESDNPYEPYNLTDKVCYKALCLEKDNFVAGRIIGGCFDVLSVLFGTPFDNTRAFCKENSDGMLWYIDNCEMNLAEFRRRIWQADFNGWFENANGFLIGRTPVAKEYFDYKYEDMLHDCFDKYQVPVFYDVDIGHIAPQWTMINGAYGEFKFYDGKGELTQKMVK